MLSEISAQTNLVSSNIPILTIDTDKSIIPDEPKIKAKMTLINNDNGGRNFADQTNIEYDGYCGIEIRGSSSTFFPKKGYALETWDSNGVKLNTSLLGLPVENDWILYGPYSDKSLIRNVLAFELARNIGHYASRSKFCELVINGDYRGVYVLMEKIKRDKNRVDIEKITKGDNSGDELTGGYLIQIDRDDEYGWYSQFVPFPRATQRVYFQYREPKGDDITTEQEEYIQNYIYNFESAMDGEHFNHPYDGYPGLINLNSLIDLVLLNELGKNVDAYRLSTFMYKYADSKDNTLFFGPIWDFNIAFGNADFYNGERTDGWQILFKSADNHPAPFWFAKIMKDSYFYNQLSKRWFELREKKLSDENIFGVIDSLSQFLDESSDRNFSRWKILGTYVWPNPLVMQYYDQEIEYLKLWIKQRLEWMDGKLNSEYSYIYWTKPDSLSSVSLSNSSFVVPVGSLIKERVQIDSIQFLARNGNVNFETNQTNIEINGTTGNPVSFKVIGYYEDEIVEISPEYNFDATLTDVKYADNQLPAEHYLSQNYPNPFNPTTTIQYRIPAILDVRTGADLKISDRDNLSEGRYLSLPQTHVKLIVYDILGREIKTLINEKQNSGYHEIIFNAGDLPSGVYLYKLQTAEFTDIKKMILIR